MTKTVLVLIYTNLSFGYFCLVGKDSFANRYFRKGHTMKVYVDPNICGSTSNCVDISPDIFELNEDGIAIVKVDKVPIALQQDCREAAENCPTNAIVIEE